MNGMQRIGVVLAGIWLLILSSYLVWEISNYPVRFDTVYTHDPKQYIGNQVDEFVFVKINKTPGIEARTAKELEFFEQYIREADSEESKRSWEEARDLPEYNASINFGRFIFVFLFPIIVLKIGYKLYLWVKAGFELNK